MTQQENPYHGEADDAVPGVMQSAEDMPAEDLVTGYHCEGKAVTF